MTLEGEPRQVFDAESEQSTPAWGHARVVNPFTFLTLGLVVGAILGAAWASSVLDVLALHLLGVVLIVVGLLPGFPALRAMLRARTSPDPKRPTTAIVTGGSYRFTRNPMYLGMFVIYAGIAVILALPWAPVRLPLVFVGVDRLAVAREEAYLERKFGAEYTEYKARVRRWI